MNGIAVPTVADSTLQISAQPVRSQQFSLFSVATTHQGGSANGFREILANCSGSNTAALRTVGDSAVPRTTMRFTDAVGGALGGALGGAHRQAGVGRIANPAAGFVLSSLGGATDASVYLGQTTLTTAGALPTRDRRGPWLIGSQRGSAEFWRGEIEALLVCDRALSGAERSAVISCLGEKYRVAAPVPEPGEWLLLITGLVLLGARARRRAG